MSNELITTKEQPKLIDASSSLVNILAERGAISEIHVRVRFKDGHIEKGVARHHDDRIGSGNGPVVVIPNEEQSQERLIALGGHTVYATPPKVSSHNMLSHRHVMPAQTTASQVPINSDTEGILFEVIEKNNS